MIELLDRNILWGLISRFFGEITSGSFRSVNENIAEMIFVTSIMGTGI